MLPESYLEYLYLFHIKRDYFECHEVLEDYWKAAPLGERERVWRVLIQIAVALYHYRRHNFTGAEKLIKKARNHLSLCRRELRQLGIDEIRLDHILRMLLERLSSQKGYIAVCLPVKHRVRTLSLKRKKDY